MARKGAPLTSAELAAGNFASPEDVLFGPSCRQPARLTFQMNGKKVGKSLFATALLKFWGCQN